MTGFKFLHRATGLPGGNPETDRVVVCDGGNRPVQTALRNLTFSFMMSVFI
jgi:hypothetical protein